MLDLILSGRPYLLTAYLVVASLSTGLAVASSLPEEAGERLMSWLSFPGLPGWGLLLVVVLFVAIGVAALSSSNRGVQQRRLSSRSAF